MAHLVKKNSETDEGVKRYNLVLPTSLFNQLQAVANKRNESVVSILRQFIKLGLMIVEMEEKNGAQLILREEDREILIKPIL